MDPINQPEFELCMWLIANALYKVDSVINNPRDIVAWQPISNYLKYKGNFADLIKAIDLTPLYKAKKEYENTEISAVTDSDINFVFFDKAWSEATVGELAVRLPDLAEYKRCEKRQNEWAKNFCSRYLELIEQQKRVRYQQ